MFELCQHNESTGNSLTFNYIPQELTFSNGNSFFNTGREYNYRYRTVLMYYYLRKDSDYIPLICAINESRNGTNVSAVSFDINIQKKIKSIYNDNDIISKLDKKDEVIENLNNIYKIINNRFVNNYSRHIPIGNCQYFNSQVKQAGLKDVFLSRNTGNFILFDKGESMIHPGMYVYNGRVMMMIVAKKEHLVAFKENLSSNKIDPTTCELWVDKTLINTKDRKMFHRYIREKLMMKLTLQGFTIKEKDCILSELTYIPNLKFKKIQDIINFKKNVNKMLLS